jgi:hypothetical protein
MYTYIYYTPVTHIYLYILVYTSIYYLFIYTIYLYLLLYFYTSIYYLLLYTMYFYTLLYTVYLYTHSHTTGRALPTRRQPRRSHDPPLYPPRPAHYPSLSAHRRHGGCGYTHHHLWGHLLLSHARQDRLM